MNARQNLRVLLLMAAMLAAADSRAVPINFGTSEAITFRDCIAGGSGCDDVSPQLQTVYGGFPGAALSSASSTRAGYGTATGSAALSGTIGAPVLRGSTTSAPGTRQNTNSVALQSYTYTGSVASTRTFGGTLTYSQMLTGAYAHSPGIAAFINLFTLPGSTVDVGDTPESNHLTLSDPAAFPGYLSLGLDEYIDTASTAGSTGLLDVTVTLNPGDTIWVWVLLQTPSANGSAIDATRTFVTGWDNPADLIPAVVAVPEPGSLALIGLGLAGLAASRLRRQN